jgi:hypothetical protein
VLVMMAQEAGGCTFALSIQSRQEYLVASAVYVYSYSSETVPVPRDVHGWTSRAACVAARVRSNRTFLVSTPALTCAFLEYSLALIYLNLSVLARAYVPPLTNLYKHFSALTPVPRTDSPSTQDIGTFAK